MIEAIFNWCVSLLHLLAGQLGMTYKEINVWVFVFIWPAVTLALTGLVILQQLRIRRLLRDSRTLRESLATEQGAG